VLSADNALPHLLEDAELARALTAMRSRLSAGGLLVVTIRDYDAALLERPPVGPPTVIAGPPRRVVVRLHEWDAPASPLYTVRFLICTEHRDRWSVEQHQARYRAITRQALTGLAEQARFGDVTWRSGAECGMHQPVMTATAV